MTATYSERFIPRIKTKGIDCEGAAECTALTCTTVTTGEGSPSAPAIVCPSDADTGLWWAPGAKALRWGVDGVRNFSLSSSGPNVHGYGTAPALNAYRSNGTESSPTTAGDTATLFNFTGYGYDGSAYTAGPIMRFIVDGTPASGVVPGAIHFLTRTGAGVSEQCLVLRANRTTEVQGALAHQGSTLGFYNTTPGTKPTITGARDSNPALADLLTKLAALGLITDSTTAT